MHFALHLSGSNKSEARYYLLCFNWSPSQPENHCASFSNSHTAPLAWAEMSSMEKPLNSYTLKLWLKLKKKAECQELLWANDEQANPPRLVHSILLNWAILLATRDLYWLIWLYCFLQNLETIASFTPLLFFSIGWDMVSKSVHHSLKDVPREGGHLSFPIRKIK